MVLVVTICELFDFLLVLDCPFSKIWRKLMEKSLVSGVPGNLDLVIDWLLLNAKWKSFRSTSLKCSFAAAVYAIWRERNKRIFQAQSTNI